MASMINPRIAKMPASAVDTSALDHAPVKVDAASGTDENSRKLTLLDSQHEDRLLAEGFVQDVFFKAYQAKLSTFYPLLLSISEQTDRGQHHYSAVAGVRPAGSEPLFLEQYLEQSVEQVLDVPREKIIEIGNLAPANAGQARWLITTLNAFMLGAGFTHVVFTAVPKLKNAFSRMGLPLAELAKAHCDVLSAEEKANWGSYYEANPMVFAGDLRVGEAPLTAAAKLDPFLHNLCQRANQAGEDFISNLSNRH
ncbi:MAG: thermostable hemolysin [Gammaproteobacteria bacterium]|nr:thermostable hemolysin [Gammaproteobacteria bacterium]